MIAWLAAARRPEEGDSEVEGETRAESCDPAAGVVIEVVGEVAVAEVVVEVETRVGIEHPVHAEREEIGRAHV